jgi:hypothetical protein
MNKAHDAWVTKNDAAILVLEKAIGVRNDDVSPPQRRAFRYGYEAGIEAAAKACEAEINSLRRAGLTSCANGATGCLNAIRALLVEPETTREGG